MAQKFGITIKRKSKLKEFNDVVKKMANSHVKIGVNESAGAHDGEGPTLSNADIASFHEFGTTFEDGSENIPQRSFIGSSIDELRPELKELSKKLQGQILVGKLTTKQALGLLGEKVKAHIINKINSGIDPGNAPETIIRKGSTTPLIDTGQLKQSITYKVEE